MLQLLLLACLWAHVQALALPQYDDVVGTFPSSNDTSELEAILKLPSVALPGDLEPYRIYGCTQDQNAALTEILQASRDVLPKIIEDAKLGTQSTHGFTAFFKKTGSTFSKSTNVPQKLLENVLNMDSVPGLYPLSRGRRTGLRTSTAPRPTARKKQLTGPARLTRRSRPSPCSTRTSFTSVPRPGSRTRSSFPTRRRERIACPCCSHRTGSTPPTTDGSPASRII